MIFWKIKKRNDIVSHAFCFLFTFVAETASLKTNYWLSLSLKANADFEGVASFAILKEITISIKEALDWCLKGL